MFDSDEIENDLASVDAAMMVRRRIPDTPRWRLSTRLFKNRFRGGGVVG
jgi:hypothetical protein